MQYTFALIIEKVLQELACTPIFLHSAPQATVKGMATYHRHSSTSSAYIYVIDNSKGTRPLSSYEPVQNCVYLASPLESASDAHNISYYKTWAEGEGNRSLLVLPSTISRRQMEKAVMSVFSFYNDWCEGVLQKIQTHGDWFSFIDLAHDILQNPMLIYDNSMKVLAYTRNDGTSDPLWTDTVAAKTAHTDSAEESLELLKYVEKLDQYDKPFRHMGKGMSYPFYSCNIMANGRRLGMVTETEYNHLVTQGHQDLLWVFSNLLSIQTQQENAQKQTAGMTNRQLIRDLLDGTITSTNLLTTRLVASHWHPLPVIRILQFGPAIPFITETQWSRGLDALDALPLHGMGCLFPDQIVYLCTTETTEIPTAMLETIRRLCEAYHFRCGISDSFTKLLDVHRYRNQPKLALELSLEPLCFYKDVRFANLKQHFQNYETPDDLIHPAILRLQQLDAETGSEYIRTLQALFENQYSQVGAALSLGIHRTTLFYRLQKIEELTGIRITDAQEMFHLQISLLICEK